MHVQNKFVLHLYKIKNIYMMRVKNKYINKIIKMNALL